MNNHIHSACFVRVLPSNKLSCVFKVDHRRTRRGGGGGAVAAAPPLEFFK